MKQTIKINSLKDIYKNYDIFIIDQWGVMHDGNEVLPYAINCVDKLFDAEKKLVIISNSSKRKDSTLLNLNKLGFKINHFSEIMTSGEMIWKYLVNENSIEIKNHGNNCYHINDETKEDSKDFLIGLEKFNFVDNIDNADFILGCTPFSKKKLLDYFPILNLALKKNMNFICANPDFEVFDSYLKKTQFCMGTISELYKNLGGKTFFLGKPSTEIYQESLRNMPNIPKTKILAIGDSLHHDILGATNFGIDSLLITSTGIHQKYFDIKNPNWYSNINILQKLDIKPTFICSDFTF